MKLLKRPAVWAATFMLLLSCSKTKYTEKAREWASNIPGVTKIQCNGACSIDNDHCTVFREKGDPIPIKCDDDGCWISTGRD